MKFFAVPRGFRNEKGASLVELAIVTPFLLVLLVGLIEFGWIFAGYISVTGAAREGARYASMGKDPDVIEIAIEEHANNFVENQQGSITQIVIPANYPEGIAMGQEVKIEVYAVLPSLTGLLTGGGGVIPFPLVPDPFPLYAKVSMRKVIAN